MTLWWFCNLWKQGRQEQILCVQWLSLTIFADFAVIPRCFRLLIVQWSFGWDTNRSERRWELCTLPKGRTFPVSLWVGGRLEEFWFEELLRTLHFLHCIILSFAILSQERARLTRQRNWKLIPSNRLFEQAEEIILAKTAFMNPLNVLGVIPE